MSDSPIHLRHGDPIPDWVPVLETVIFGKPWGPLERHEHLLFLPAAFIRWSVIPAAQEAELLRIAVAPDVRRGGLARKLLLASDPFLRAEGIENLYLEVRASNAPARALYESMGWTVQRIRKAYYGDGEDAVIHWKALSNL